MTSPVAFYTSHQARSPLDFGAAGDDGNTDDAVAIQACIDAVKADYNANIGAYRSYVDLRGKIYKTGTSLDLTGIKGRRFKIVNGSIIGACAGAAVMDFTGSNGYEIDDIYVTGQQANAPSIGMLFARNVNAVEAGTSSIGTVEVAGYYTQAAWLNYGSEIVSLRRGRIANSSTSMTAATAIFCGNRAVIEGYVGAISSQYQTIVSGDQSMSNNLLGNMDFRRSPAVSLAISNITNANPAVVTVSSIPALATAIAGFGFGNGSIVGFPAITGMTQLGGNRYTIANLNAGAGTMELSGIDSTGYGTFLHAVMSSAAGPNVIIGGVSDFKVEQAYFNTVAGPGLIVDLTPVSGDGLHNFEMASCRFELGNARDVQIIGNSGACYARGFKLNCDLSSALVCTITPSGVSGAGSITIDRADISVLFKSQSPSAGLIDTPGVFNLTSGNVYVPSSAFLVKRSAFISDQTIWTMGT